MLTEELPEAFLADNQQLALRRELAPHRLGEVLVELGEGQAVEQAGEVVVRLPLDDRSWQKRTRVDEFP